MLTNNFNILHYLRIYSNCLYLCKPESHLLYTLCMYFLYKIHLQERIDDGLLGFCLLNIYEFYGNGHNYNDNNNDDDDDDDDGC